MYQSSLFHIGGTLFPNQDIVDYMTLDLCREYTVTQNAML